MFRFAQHDKKNLRYNKSPIAVLQMNGLRRNDDAMKN